VVIYWIALPLTLLGAVSGFVSLIFGFGRTSTPDYQLPMTLGCTVLAGLLVWRLWLNSRALGWAGPVPRPRRVLLVWAPLSLLALIGLLVLALGLIWLVIASLLLLAPENSTLAFRQLVMGFGIALGGGAVMSVIGAALMFPLVRLIRTRPRPVVEA
jgi:hypothetical protein